MFRYYYFFSFRLIVLNVVVVVVIVLKYLHLNVNEIHMFTNVNNLMSVESLVYARKGKQLRYDFKVYNWLDCHRTSVEQ